MSIGRFVSFPIGLVLIAVGIIIWFTVNTAIHKTLDNAAVTLPENDKNDLVNPWTRFVSNEGDENNIRIYNYYAYNLTNPLETIAGELPIYEEIGPYQYNYVYKKLGLNFSDDENIVSFQNWKTYAPILNNIETRDPTKDVIYHINLAYVAAIPQIGGEAGLFFILAQKTNVQVQAAIAGPFIQALRLTPPMPVISQLWNELLDYCAGNADLAVEYWANPPSRPANLTVANIFFPPTNTLDYTNGILIFFFDPDTPSSFLDPGGYQNWLSEPGSAEYSALENEFMDSYGLTTEQFALLHTWYNNLYDSIILAIAQSHPLCQVPGYTCTLADIPAVQFGSSSGLMNGASVSDFSNGTIRGPPEFGISTGGKSLTLAAVKYLWNPASPMSFFTLGGLQALVVTVKSQNNTRLLELSGGLIDLQTGANLVGYLNNMTSYLGYYAIYMANGGPVVKHSVNDFLFHSQDPLLAMLGKNPNSAPLTNYTTEEEATKNLPIDKTYTGKDNSQLSQVPITFHGHDTVKYAINISVSGHNSENIGPFFIPDSGSQDPPLELFSDEYARTLYMEREVVGNLGGLRYYRYRMSPSNWAVNATMFTTIDHLLNMTSTMGVPIYISRPRLKGMSPEYLAKAGISELSFLTDDNDVYGDYEPYTGKAIRGRYSLQVNYYVDGSDHGISPTFNIFNKLRSDVVHPMLWGKNEVDASKDQINLIRTGYRVDAFRYAITIILIVVGSLLVLSVVGLYIIDSLEAKGFFSN